MIAPDHPWSPFKSVPLLLLWNGRWKGEPGANSKKKKKNIRPERDMSPLFTNKLKNKVF